MRLCHVAGIRPVLSRPNVLCCSHQQPQLVARLNRLSFSFRHKSSNNNHVDNTIGNRMSDEEKKIDQEIRAIMDSMRGPASGLGPAPAPAPALATESLGSLEGQDVAVYSASSLGEHNNATRSSDNRPRDALRKKRSKAAKSSKRAGQAAQPENPPEVDQVKDALEGKTPRQNTAKAQKLSGGKKKAQANVTTTQDPLEEKEEVQQETVSDNLPVQTDGVGKDGQDGVNHAIAKIAEERAAAITATGPAARNKRYRLRKLGRTRVRLTNPRKPLNEISNLPEQKTSQVEDEPHLFEPVRTMTLEEAMKGNQLETTLSEETMKGNQLETTLSDETSTRPHKRMSANIEYLKASELDLTPLLVDQPPVPRLSHGLDRVLFNQGVYQLQDPYSMVYNFDPYVQKIMPVTEFDFNALAEYKTSSQDTLLANMAQEHNIKYVGSTSSMTSTLGHFHYLLSNWRNINLGMLSKDFPETSTTFTEINRAPNAMFLRRKNGIYAIDADKEYDGANVLMLLGKSLEKLLTMTPDDFERYRKSDPRQISETERNAPDSFHFSTQGDFLMRSQLDAHDPRLPGTGMFDLKTRAVISVRMQSDDYEEMSGYEVHKQHGRFESYEREYYDMARSTMLKYSLQARMGRMDGIFVAYHNVKRIFGFQYLNLGEMDRALHGQSDRCLGNQEFGLSIELLNKVLNKATERYPDKSIRFHFETRQSGLPFMYIFAEPMAEEDIDKIQNSQKAKVAKFEREVMGLESKEEKEADEAIDTATAEDDQVSMQLPLTSEDTIELETGTLNTTGTLNMTGVQPPPTPEPTIPTTVEDEATDSKTAETAPVDPPAATNLPSYPSLNTSDSAADSSFLSLLTLNSTSSAPKNESHRDLIAFTLTVRSRVNGAYVERPERLTPSDKWSVEYSLSEIASPERAWALYEATKARRRKVFERANKTDDENQDGSAGGGGGGGGGNSRRGRGAGDDYIRMLRQLSQKGRDLRAEIDAVEADRGEKVVFGETYGGVDQGRVSDDVVVDIKGVDDYTRWLFGQGAGR